MFHPLLHCNKEQSKMILVLCKNSYQDYEKVNITNPPKYALVYKSRHERQEIVLLICFLPLKDGRKISYYRKITEDLQLNTEKTRSNYLTDSLEIVAIQDDGDNPWWNQFFQGTKTPHQYTYDHHQLVYFDLSDGNKNYDHFPEKADWSLLLHRINSCHSIKKIMISGKIPVNCYSERTKRDNTENDSGTHKKSPQRKLSASGQQKMKQFFLENSLTVLHLRDLCVSRRGSSFDFPSIALIRFARVFLHNRRNVLASENSENAPINYCGQYSKPSFLRPRSELASEAVSRLDVSLSALFDVILGFTVSVVLIIVTRNPQLIQLYLDFKQKTFQYLEDQSFMLETFPAGFKLNVQLTNTMGCGIRNLLNHQRCIFGVTLWNLRVCQNVVCPLLALLAAVGGWTTFLAMIVDLWRLEFIHLILLTAFFRKLYRAELYLLSALFRLFRGKKLNILRQRIDSMPYDSMQLLVGTIAFCICVFLWTTIMVYYSFFMVWNLLMHLPVVVCWVLYLLSRSIPWGSLFFRFRHPNWFPKDIYLEFNNVITLDGKKNIQITSLQSTLEPPLQILFGRIIFLREIFRWYLIWFLEIIYPSASNTNSSLPLKRFTATDTFTATNARNKERWCPS